MSLLVYIAHTGHRLETDPSAYGSVEEFQEWIAQKSAVPSARQVLMTSRGKIVKFQALFSENEIFVYDRNLFSTAGRSISHEDVLDATIQRCLEIPDPPDTLADESRLKAWQELFKERKSWAQQVAEQATMLRTYVLRYDGEIANILRATAIAAERVKNNSGGLHTSITEAQKWSESVTDEPNLVLQNWDKTLRRMSSVKTTPQFLHFFQPPGDLDATQSTGDKILFGLVSKPDANRAASRGKQAINWLESQVAEIKDRYGGLMRESTALVDEFRSQSKAFAGHVKHTLDDLSEECDTICDKIEKDCEDVQNAEEGPRSIANISKTALLHTRNLLPSLLEASRELAQLLRQTVQSKNDCAALATRHMQKISSVESSFAELKTSVTNLEISDDDDRLALDTLTFINQLPFLYGSTLIEVIRRNEWVEKMTKDTSTLADEMYVYKDEEERRRKKWSKQLEHYLSSQATNSNAIGVDVTLTHAEPNDQHFKRADIDAYITQLGKIGDCEEALMQLREAVKALDAPSKQQTKRANAFKNGSVHEAAYGRNSLLLRGDDDLIHTIQGEKSRLEDRLKGSESRVRKLEDLLHRQTQISRPAIGTSRPSLESQPSSPRLPQVSLSPRAEPLPFRPSVASSRRVSQNHSMEDKALVQRLLQLESELEAERVKSAQAEQSSADQRRTHNELQQQVQEAASMKRDLMDNFEAQQTEFDGERRLLLTDNRSLKMKIDELEEELDRLSGSQDHKALLSEKNQALEIEIDSLRKEAATEFETLQSHIKDLQKEQKDRHDLLDAKETRFREERRDWENKTSGLQQELKTMAKQSNEQRKSLQAIHQILTTEPAPQELSEVTIALEAVGREAANDLKDLRTTLGIMKSQNDELEAGVNFHKQLGQALQDKIKQGETSAQALQENLHGQQMQIKSLENLLEEERAELSSLRAQLSDGESGPEALRNRIIDEERKVRALSSDISSAQSHSQRLERLLKDRASRAEEVSQMLFRQTDGLTHLLEHVGFNVTRHEDGMIIQKISRPAKDSALIGASQSIERALSGPIPAISTSLPPGYIHWALASDEEEECEQYEAFAHESKAFDLEAFCEAIIKRIKDTEHIARKWQREAKNYRDRFHKSQFESQNKIAFRAFREGDLALFLPTRNQAPKRSWAAFNVGAPHYFLREHETHRLKSRDWLLARIAKAEERVVDLSKGSNTQSPSGHLLPPGTEEPAAEEENPFGLSDGLRWYYLDAAEERVGAPSTPGMGKSTVASAQVDAAGSIPRKEKPDDSAVTRTLAKSLDSRRSSGNSRKSLVGVAGGAPGIVGESSGGSNLRDVEHADGEAGEGSVGNRDLQAPLTEEEEIPHLSVQESGRSSSLTKQADGTLSAEQRPKSPLKSRAWDALWSLDLNLEGKRNRS